MSRFTKILVVSPLADGKTWYLREEFGYDVGHEGSDDSIHVPVGFLTDFASVPRLLWWLLPCWGRYGNAAVIHDFLYWEQSRTRKESDRVFLEAMGVLRVGWLVRYALFSAVRMFGWWAWAGRDRRARAGQSKMADRPPETCLDQPEDLLK
jgi:hypothetical protein